MPSFTSSDQELVQQRDQRLLAGGKRRDNQSYSKHVITAVGQDAALQNRLHKLTKIDSCHIVRIRSVARAADGFTVAIENIEGPTLKTLKTSKDGLSVGEAYRLLRDLCEALQHLHSHGIVHGDISPNNIIVRADHPQGHAVVIDLVPRPGWKGGTPGFQAPEVEAGSAPNHISDLWSAVRVTQWASRQLNQISFASAFSDVLTNPPHTRPALKEIAQRAESLAAPRLELPEAAQLASAHMRIQQQGPLISTTQAKRMPTHKRRSHWAKAVVMGMIASATYFGVDLVADGNAPAPSVASTAPAFGGPESSDDSHISASDIGELVQELTAHRDHALKQGDSALLRSLTVPGSPAAERDEALLEALGPAVAEGIETRIDVSKVHNAGESIHIWAKSTQGPFTWKGGSLDGKNVPAQPAKCIVLELQSHHDDWLVNEVSSCAASESFL